MVSEFHPCFIIIFIILFIIYVSSFLDDALFPPRVMAPFHPPVVPRPQCRCPQSRAFFLLYALVEKKFPPEYFSCYKMLEGVRADQWVVPAPGPGGGGAGESRRSHRWKCVSLSAETSSAN